METPQPRRGAHSSWHPPRCCSRHEWGSPRLPLPGPHPPIPTTQALKRDPHPHAGGTGLLARHLPRAPAPRHGHGAAAAPLPVSPAAPSPGFGSDSLGTGTESREGAGGGDEARRDPRGGGRSGWWDPAGPLGLRLAQSRGTGGCGPLEDVDLVPLDTVQVIVQRQQHLQSERTG